MKKMGGRDYQLWDEEDGFFYDVLRYPSGAVSQVPRALAGRPDSALRDRRARRRRARRRMPIFVTDVHWFIRNRPDLVGQACYTEIAGRQAPRRSVDRRSPPAREAAAARSGTNRSSSRRAASAACRSITSSIRSRFGAGTVRYEPAEADVKIKGGNSNWRGPIWFPDVLPADRIAREVLRGVRPGVQGQVARASGREGDDARTRWLARWPTA